MLSSKVCNYIAAAMLILMSALLFFSQLNDSATMDELAHIPAAYSYVKFQDYRLNPEHPPLMKDLAGLPLLFLNLKFPTTHSAWTYEVNGQWTLGRVFLYESGNNPDQIIFWARLPMILLTLLFGFLLYWWAKRYYGEKVAILALFFFVFSPTIIAHGRYVTTDIAAAFGFFIGLITYVRYLESPGWKNLILSGFALGTALLLKFSAALLIPVFAGLGILWIFISHIYHVKENAPKSEILKHISSELVYLFLNLLLISVIALALVWLVYLTNIWNYPAERQLADLDHNLATFGKHHLVDITRSMSENSLTRPLGQYLHGLLMVIQRAAGGNTAYFWGEVTNTGWAWYFPIAYLLKESVGFHLLTAVALIFAIYGIWRTHDKSLGAIMEWTRDNFILTASIVFIAVYWWQSIRSPLNIGVRHVVPTFPFIYLLVSREIIKWAQKYSYADPQNIREWLVTLYEKYIKSAPKYAFVFLILLWIAASAALSFPHYISYYNEFVGGPKNGYKYIVDSNYDWGQDLKRLAQFIERNRIEKVRLDYFGGGSPEYYLKDKYEQWWSAKGFPPGGGWYAVSSNHLMGAQGTPVRGFKIKPEDSYSWLKDIEPSARAGYSIFIYKF